MPAVTPTEFLELSQPLIGLLVLQADNSFGSAIHLKLGTSDSIYESESIHADRERGAVISVYWDWRLEDNATIIAGSSDQRSVIQNTIGKLIPLTIVELCIESPLPDLTVVFSNGWRLRSMALVAGDPQWHISLPDGSNLGGRRGRLIHSREHIAEEYHPDPRVEREMDLGVSANGRWMNDLAKSARGRCGDCDYFIDLDGPGAFLWYGACACAASTNDGRVVHQESGCEAFKSRIN